MAQLDVMKIFFHGREEIMKVLNVNESIVKSLSDVKNPVCPLIGTHIKLVKKIGQGSMGVIFEIEFSNKGKRKYVVKLADVPNELLVIYGKQHQKFSSKTFLDIQKMYQINANVVINYNNLTSAPFDNIKGQIIIPLFKKGCSLRSKLKIPRLDGRGYVIFGPGDQICETQYTEFVIALLVGEFYRSGQSINFLDTFYFATCIDGGNLKDVKQYTFMEKIDSSLRNTVNCLCETNYHGVKNPNYIPQVMDCIVIQILHAIATYQEQYKIVHGDLHEDNIFLEYVNEETTWKGKKVINVDYYQYNIKGVRLYIPGGKTCPFIVKIGDWGIACKYSSPMIAENTTIYDGYDQHDGRGAWLPNFYTTAYDPLFIVHNLYTLNKSNKFIQDIFAWMLNLPQNLLVDQEKSFVDTRRPKLHLLETTLAHVDPINILTNKTLVSKYLSSPLPGNTILLLGEIL